MAKTAADHARDYAQMRKKDAEAEKAWKEKQQREKYGTSYLPSKDFGWTPKPTAPTFPGVMPPSGGSSKNNFGNSEDNGGGYGGGGGGSIEVATTTSDPYDSAFAYYEQLMEAEREAIRAQQRADEERRRAAIEQGVGTLNAQKPLLEQQYQSAAQQAYIQMMQAKKTLPQAMTAQGIGGGLAESSLVDLDASYGNSLNALLQQKNQGVSDIDRDIANLRASGDISIADAASAYAQKFQELAQEARAKQMAQAAKYTGSSVAGSPLSFSQAQSAYGNGIRTPNVINALKAGYGDDWEPEPYLNDKAKAWIERADANMLEGLWPKSEKYDQMDILAKVVLDAYKSGQFTWDEALAIANHYGFSISD